VCLYPKIIKNRKYIANKKNGGVIPPINDERCRWVPVGCGKCMECKKQKAREWQVRLNEDVRTNKNGKFVTLTFSDQSLIELENEIKDLEGYDRDNEVCRIAVRRFTERWRKKYKKTIRHWLVTEIGGTRTERIHLHGILWTDDVKDIEPIWKYGNIWIGRYVTERTMNYMVKYVNKTDEKHKEYNSKIFASKGIGKGYTERRDARRNEYKKGETIETYRTRKGVELSLPIYYRNKIYTDEEKEKLWIEKLDKDERWINGIKIDISKGMEDYYEILREERNKNKRLGYGNDEINWSVKKYEQERRNLKVQERLETMKKRSL
jgi:hypothetical protein